MFGQRRKAYLGSGGGANQCSLLINTPKYHWVCMCTRWSTTSSNVRIVDVMLHLPLFEHARYSGIELVNRSVSQLFKQPINPSINPSINGSK